MRSLLYYRSRLFQILFASAVVGWLLSTIIIIFLLSPPTFELYSGATDGIQNFVSDWHLCPLEHKHASEENDSKYPNIDNLFAWPRLIIEKQFLPANVSGHYAIMILEARYNFDTENIHFLAILDELNVMTGTSRNNTKWTRNSAVKNATARRHSHAYENCSPKHQEFISYLTIGLRCHNIETGQSEPINIGLSRRHLASFEMVCPLSLHKERKRQPPVRVKIIFSYTPPNPIPREPSISSLQDIKSTTIFDSPLTNESKLAVSTTASLCYITERVVEISFCTKPLYGLNETQMKYRMRDFIQHHAFLGIERFFIYDRYGTYHPLLQPYIDSGIAVYQYTPLPYPIYPPVYDIASYLHATMLEACRMRNYRATKWIGTFDIDEFLIFRLNQSEQISSSYRKAPRFRPASCLRYTKLKNGYESLWVDFNRRVTCNSMLRDFLSTVWNTSRQSINGVRFSEDVQIRTVEFRAESEQFKNDMQSLPPSKRAAMALKYPLLLRYQQSTIYSRIDEKYFFKAQAPVILSTHFPMAQSPICEWRVMEKNPLMRQVLPDTIHVYFAHFSTSAGRARHPGALDIYELILPVDKIYPEHAMYYWAVQKHLASLLKTALP